MGTKSTCAFCYSPPAPLQKLSLSKIVLSELEASWERSHIWRQTARKQAMVCRSGLIPLTDISLALNIVLSDVALYMTRQTYMWRDEPTWALSSFAPQTIHICCIQVGIRAFPQNNKQNIWCPIGKNIPVYQKQSIQTQNSQLKALWPPRDDSYVIKLVKIEWLTYDMPRHMWGRTMTLATHSSGPHLNVCFFNTWSTCFLGVMIDGLVKTSMCSSYERRKS